MKVRYNRAVGVVPLVAGVVFWILGLWFIALGEFSPVVLGGILLTATGILYLVRPYFRVTAAHVEVPALFGPVRRSYPFRTLEVDGGKLVAVRDDGIRKKVPVSRWMANSTDWAIATGGR